MILTIFLFARCSEQHPQLTTLILLRHAEKDNDGTEDPGLTAEGIDRANRLTRFLKEVKIDGIYSTNYKRTRNTVTPLASDKSVEVQEYEAFKDDDIEKILEAHKGGTVVICGHSNNIPWTANLLVGKEEFKDFEDAEYGLMLFVSVLEKGKVAKVTPLRW
jgi:broad specificity phosphatase PhoE